MLGGKWHYRSYLNDSDQTVFGDGIFTFEQISSSAVAGQLDMGGGYVLALRGEVRKGRGGCPDTIALVGLGVDGTPTAGWRYDYHCWPAYKWPNGIKQVPSLVGTVIRVKAHGPKSPAGVTASFIAVSQG
jgi:hypothetical protein